MSDLNTIAQAIQVRREQHPLPRAAGAYLEQDDLASLLRRPKCQHGDLQRLLSRRVGPAFSELRNFTNDERAFRE
jgi:hypothetical protein